MSPCSSSSSRPETEDDGDNETRRGIEDDEDDYERRRGIEDEDDNDYAEAVVESRPFFRFAWTDPPLVVRIPPLGFISTYPLRFRAPACGPSLAAHIAGVAYVPSS